MINNQLFVILFKAKYKFKIKFKHQSILMKIIGFLLFFNKKFMTNFVTTTGTTIYFPENYDFNKLSAIVTIAHEVKHILDMRSNRLFRFLYFFPQILSVLLIGLLFWHWSFIFLILLFLSPAIPAFFRSKYEFDAYVISLYVINLLLTYQNFSKEKRKEVLIENAKRINEHFVGPNYYYMFIFGKLNQFKKFIDLILSNEFEKNNNYALEIKSIFEQSIE